MWEVLIILITIAAIFVVWWVFGRSPTQPPPNPHPHAILPLVKSNKPVMLFYNGIRVPPNNIVLHPNKTPLMIEDITSVTVHTEDFPAEVTLALPYDKVEVQHKLSQQVEETLEPATPFILAKPYFYTFTIVWPEVEEI